MPTMPFLPADLTALADAVPWPVVLIIPALIAFTIVYRLGVRRTKKKHKLTAVADTKAVPSWLTWGTVATAVLGAALCMDGIMIFLEQRGFAGYELTGALAFFQVVTIMLAGWAKHTRKTKGSAGIPGLLVWLVAATEGTFAALGAGGLNSVGIFRLLIALTVVVLWEIRLLAETEANLASAFAERFRRVRLFFGWDDPADRDALTANRDRLRTNLVNARYRAHIALSFDPKKEKWATKRAVKKATNLWSDAQRKGILVSDEDMARIMRELQILYTGWDSTSAEYIGYNPWDTVRDKLHTAPVPPSLVPSPAVPQPVPVDLYTALAVPADPGHAPRRDVPLLNDTAAALAEAGQTVVWDIADTDDAKRPRDTRTVPQAARPATAPDDGESTGDKVVTAFLAYWNAESKAPSIRTLEKLTGIPKSVVGRTLTNDDSVRERLNGKLRA